MRRVLVSLIVFCLTAFAPAPLPRKDRHGDADAVNLPRLQGEYRVISFDSTGANNSLTPIGQWFQGVRIRDDRWIYLVEGQERDTFRLTIGGNRPATIDFFQLTQNPDKSYMIGLVRRQGNRVSVLYYWTPVNRATSFETMPSGWWLLVLERR